MNRRAFLKGCAAVAVASQVVPSLVTTPAMELLEDFEQLKASYEQWLKDTADIFSDCFSNTIIFGVGAIRQVEQYPYIESVDPYQLPWPKTSGGLLEQP